MSFVDECRREWKRLGVPNAVANEMAAELTADLAEAEAEGASPEEVLGYAVFDARAFAAQWAEERGVIPPAPSPRRRLAPVPLVVVVGICIVVVAIGIAALSGAASTQVSVAGVPHAAVSPPANGPTLHPPATAGLVFLGVGLGGIAVALGTWWMLDRRRRTIL